MNWSEALDEFEGRQPAMYADGGGKVTCGVGHLLHTSQDAIDAFNDPRAADDWVKVKAMAPGHLPAFYAAATVCRLTGARIDELKTVDMAAVIVRLARLHPASNQWPSGFRDAACDCLYNTGELFPAMWRAMDAGDRETAAKESHRIERPAPNGIQPARNEWARESILSA